MKKILIAVSGGIAAYKVADIISGLKKNNFEVRVITTKNALAFITPTVLGAISGGNYVTDDDPNRIAHIEEAQNCDLFMCVPATANIMAKFANGIADDFVSSTFLAIPEKTPKFIFPAMNSVMYGFYTVKKHMAELSSNIYLNCRVIRPVKGKLACGDVGIGKLPTSKFIVDEITEFMDKSQPWYWPVAQDPIGSSNDSYSYLHIDIIREVEVPLYPHVGAFGARRRHDTHRGVDLYTPVEVDVFSVEDGYIRPNNGIRPWTGKIADCDWWEDTWAVIVEGESGMVVYGEISIDNSILEQVRDIKNMNMIDPKIHIKRGQKIGTVLRVLKKDKGRPTSMLHLELRKPGFYRNIDKTWENNKVPEGILDPTPYLLRSIKHFPDFL